MSPQSRPSGLSFFGMISAVMVALKLKEHFDGGYNKVASDEEGRVALQSPPEYRDTDPGFRGEEGVGFLDNDLPRPRRQRKSCCVCCGINCGLFWKAFGIVVAGIFIWSAIKLIIWAVAPASDGLDELPSFSESLGCLDGSHFYNGGETSISVPMGARKDHSVDIRGGAIGTFIITEASAEATEIQYKFTIRSNDHSLLDGISLSYPPANDDGTSVGNSRLLLTTPRLDGSQCLRYDVTMYIPRGLKKLHVASHTLTHVQFDSQAHIDLDDFFVTLFTMDKKNMILPHENIRSKRMSLEVYRGWIVGDASIVNSTSIVTQRGDGVANVRVHPTQPVDATSPEGAFLQTTTGAGRTDIIYINDKAFPHRPINSVHISSRNGDMYLTYKDAEFEGRVLLNSNSFSATGLQLYAPEQTSGSTKWTHWAGEKDGKDQIVIKSRGWTGLYV